MLVQGVVVRSGTDEKKGRDYLVLWSPKYNHSYIYKGHTSDEEWDEAMTCDWREFEVNEIPLLGPEGILTQARNLRRVYGERSKNPCTTIDSSYKDVKSLRSVKSFIKYEHTIKFRDTFTIHGLSDRSVRGEFIENAKISPADVGQLKKFGVLKFEAVALLDYVAQANNPFPWSIMFYIYEAKELSLHGFLAKKGHLRHGRGGVLVEADKTLIPPDTLRLAKANKPSFFFVPPISPKAFQERPKPMEQPSSFQQPAEQPRANPFKKPRS